ncbi:MAG: DUF4157 domain-containing protein [Nannocystis sp.]|uniref:eCIS core domain-containing protein n=1 Tax=Nannocystis sp. TaxID=1962667 RepID=UPI002422E4B5|nr:DUF4157 domain-containing protein [Nannocystis sp.]MBK9754581.1 DUF4157 domain-containing protein [Nannocystis sp.]
MKFGGQVGPRRDRSQHSPGSSQGGLATPAWAHTPGNQALTRLLGAGASTRGFAAGHHAGLGNQALTRLRSKRAPDALRLGAHDDRFEREAHAVADAILAPTIAAGAAGPQIQRISDASGVGLRETPPGVEAAIAGARGGGRRLPGEIATTIGQRLGADLEGVRVHTDDRAHALSRTLHARAFTTGSDIFFGRGQYDPAGAAGRKVLAHELTHVVQQRGRGGGRSERGPIQRFIMQVGVDDGYTATMSAQLTEAHSDEGFLQFKAAWDKTWFGLATYGTYAPTSWHKPKGDETLPSHGPSKKLKGVADAEPLRIVGHGNIRGQIGGYSGEEMGGLLLALGLPQAHTGGVDVHGCLPASNWTDADDTVHAAHIVALEDFLTGQGVKDTVRGYEHCIYPDQDTEVASSAYGFFEIARAFNNLPKGTKQALTDTQEATIRRVMGADADAFIKDVTRGTDTVVDGLYFFLEAKKYLVAKGLMRRAKLVDTTKARAEMASD